MKKTYQEHLLNWSDVSQLSTSVIRLDLRRLIFVLCTRSVFSILACFSYFIQIICLIVFLLVLRSSGVSLGQAESEIIFFRLSLKSGDVLRLKRAI